MDLDSEWQGRAPQEKEGQEGCWGGESGRWGRAWGWAAEEIGDFELEGNCGS